MIISQKDYVSADEAAVLEYRRAKLKEAVTIPGIIMSSGSPSPKKMPELNQATEQANIANIFKQDHNSQPLIQIQPNI